MTCTFVCYFTMLYKKNILWSMLCSNQYNAYIYV